jgi:hypothetical protein
MRLGGIAAAGLTAVSLAAPLGDAVAAGTARYRVDLRVSGQLLVRFHGDPAAGCATFLRCDVGGGTVRWRPQSRLGLELVFPRARDEEAISFVSTGSPGARTAAVVRRSAADGTHVCRDSRDDVLAMLPLIEADRRGLRLGLGARRGGSGASSGGPMGTNCGGPLPADVLRRLPARTVSLRALRRGPTRVDLSGESRFAAGGLAGTVRSTIAVRVGKSDVERRPRGLQPGPRSRRRRDRPPLRSIAVEYRIERLTGSMPVAATARSRNCARVDACGLGGTLAVTPGPARGEGYVVAYGRVPRAALSRAVGLAPGPIPHKVSAYGYVAWTSGRGTVTAALDRDGTAACRDTAPLSSGLLELRLRDRRVTARIGAGAPFLGADLLRTRCPGPLLADLKPRTELAAGHLPLRALARRRVTLRLDRGASAAARGYRLRSRPDLTLVLEREKVEHSTLRALGAGD